MDESEEMGMACLKIRICADGFIYAKTKDIKGKKCTEYKTLIEKLTDAQVLEEEFTEEFYQEEYESEIMEERVQGNV